MTEGKGIAMQAPQPQKRTPSWIVACPRMKIGGKEIQVLGEPYRGAQESIPQLARDGTIVDRHLVEASGLTLADYIAEARVARNLARFG